MASKARTGAVAVVIVLCAFSGALGARGAVLDERLLVPLGRAITSPRSPRGNDSALAALRLLRDPELQPLLGRLASSSSPILRRHGILGLAELETPPRLRPVLLSTVSSSTERAFIIGEALAEDLLTVDDMETMLKSGGLEPYLEVVLRGAVGAAGRAPGTDRLRELGEDPSAIVACPALLILCAAGDSAAGERLVDRIAAAPAPERGALVAALLDQIRRDRRSGCRESIARVHELVRGDPAASLDAIRAWMMVDPASASPEWQKAFHTATELSTRLRFALVGLESSPGAPPAAFEPLLADDSALVRDIGALARSVAADDGIEDAVNAAAAHSYPPVEAWLVERLQQANESAAPEAWRAIIRAGMARDSSRAVTEGVASAARRLAPIDSPFLTEQLVTAARKNDRVMCQALLTGMLRAVPAPAWEASTVAAWPDRVTESLALVVAARSDPAFPKDGSAGTRLTEAAVGRSGLPEALRAQAAWLAARVQGQEDEAIARIVADIEP